MPAEWTDGERFGDAFPAVHRIADLRLDSLDVKALIGDEAAARSHKRVCMQASVCAELLPLTVQDIRGWRSVGEGKRREIVAFLISLGSYASVVAGDPATLTSGGYAPRHSKADSQVLVPRVADPPLQPAGDGTLDEVMNAAAPATLLVLASWVRTVTGGTAWGDLLATSGMSRPPEVAVAWDELTASEIVPENVDSAGSIIDEFVRELNAARRLLLVERVLGPGRQTLQDLGDQLAVSRERARQLEVQVAADLRSQYAYQDRWRSVRWAVGALHDRLGAFAPLGLRQGALPGMSDTARHVITWLAEYRYDGDYLVSTELIKPTAEGMPRLTAGGGVIDEFEVREGLFAAGVHEAHVDALLAGIPGLNRVDGQLVAWGSSMTEKAAVVLELRDEPQDVEELFDMAGGGSLVSFRNRIYEDPRFIRATKSKVALRSWGGRHYTSVTDLMAQRLASGPIEVDELARELHDQYEVSAHSVTMYAYAPMFKVSGDTVALRTDGDPFIPRDKPQQVRGLYRDGARTVLWHVEVDQDVLRGSGRPLPQEVGTFLGLVPGDERVELANRVDPVSVSWPPSSIVGPSIGSLRTHAEAAGASLGDILRLSITTDPPAFDLMRVPAPPPDESPVARLRRLTGLGPDFEPRLEEVAAAVGAHSADVVEVLRKRGDEAVAEAVEQVAEG